MVQNKEDIAIRILTVGSHAILRNVNLMWIVV
ncbi:unnamed protein product [Larinioides sclopetarius]|uniref:Uncharacterized protein n=1 Tax=Larinioides sclopetarius TaxID=280406 RepID=A0AAV1YXU3_9ARAC